MTPLMVDGPVLAAVGCAGAKAVPARLFDQYVVVAFRLNVEEHERRSNARMGAVVDPIRLEQEMVRAMEGDPGRLRPAGWIEAVIAVVEGEGQVEVVRRAAWFSGMCCRYALLRDPVDLDAQVDAAMLGVGLVVAGEPPAVVAPADSPRCLMGGPWAWQAAEITYRRLLTRGVAA